MRSDPLRRISKALALSLRHGSERLGLTVDPEGFVPLSEVLGALRGMGIEATEELLLATVAEVDPHKGRYSIVDDAIRANYGHSIDRQISYPRAVSPAVLFHGTNEAAKEGIFQQGLLPMGRRYVHLTNDFQLARQVGARRSKACIIRVAARQADDDGIVFLVANASFWLAKHVPSKYLALAETQ